MSTRHILRALRILGIFGIGVTAMTTLATTPANASTFGDQHFTWSASPCTINASITADRQTAPNVVTFTASATCTPGQYTSADYAALFVNGSGLGQQLHASCYNSTSSTTYPVTSVGPVSCTIPSTGATDLNYIEVSWSYDANDHILQPGCTDDISYKSCDWIEQALYL